MRTKVFAFLIVLSILATLAGCGQEPTQPPSPAPTEVAAAPTDTVQPTEPPVPTATPTVEPTEEPPTPTVVPTEEPAATFEEADCPFDVPYGQTVDCGYLVVPENRQDPGSPTIRLAVAVFRHPDGAPEPDPIVYLEGGPGGSPLEFISLTFDAAYSPLWAANRDIIIFDQRGVGFSEPVLDCPDMVELSRELLDSEIDGKLLTDEEMYNLALDTLLSCQQDLSAQADLSAYNTAENAADVNDLRLALGYDEVNLWGISYGTRLALEVMRLYPEGLRSVVLDSVYPPEVDLYLGTPASADRAFDLLFDSCAADPACSAAYPDLRTVFFDTVDRLNEEPVAIEIVHAFTGERMDGLLNGDDLMAFLFQFLYYADVIPSLPQIIYDASQGDYDMIVRLAGVLVAEQEVMSQGMHLSVQCHDEVSGSSLEEFEAVLAEYPELDSLFEDSLLGRLGYEVCAAWGAGAADAAENEPVRGDVPTLVLAGEYDPITPPDWGQQVAGTLDNGYFFEFPGQGHGTSVSSDCARDMMVAFLDDPTSAPDDACRAGMSGPEFVAPGAGAGGIVLESFVNEQMGVSGLVPAGWEEVSPGAYARGDSALDVALVLMQSGPFQAEQLLALLTQQLGLEEDPVAVGEREANDLVWTLYQVEVQGIVVDIALADAEDMALIALLQSEPDEHEALYDAVFLPVVDALVPAP